MWFLYMFGGGGSHVEIPALVPPASAVTTQTLLALTYGSLGWGPSQPPSSLKLVMQLRNMLGSACVLGVGDTDFPPGSHGTLSFFLVKKLELQGVL